MNNTVVFGWGAPSISKQFPTMDADAAQKFDADSDALTRLRIRGYVTDSQRDAIIRKMGKAIGKAIPND